MKKLKILTAAIVLFFIHWFDLNAQTVATFDDLTLPVDSFWNGSDMTGGFTDGGYYFSNSYTSYGGNSYTWGGFAYSDKNDTVTPDYTNQFSAITGIGYNNSTNYAVSSVLLDFMTNYQPVANIIKFNPAIKVNGFYITNSTYAYLAMLNGNTFSKKFGGATGNDPDWFMLQILGYHSGIVTDTVKFYLADYRFTNNSLDYIVKDWRWCDLSSLGTIDSLGFTLYSSDTGAYGMNTPSYFCMDNFNGDTPANNISELKEDQFTMNVYPNPCIDNITIFINEKISGKLTITDITGNSLKSTVDFKGGRVDLSELKAGIYFVTYSNSSGIITKKISKK